MKCPPLLKYNTILEYREHYEMYYQRGQIYTFDNIRVYFKPQKFGHAFYENSNHTNGAKDQFSFTRAERMDWIKATLENPNATLYEGWNKATKSYDKTRRVSVVYDAFIVVIEVNLTKRGDLKGDFVTCYVADRSITRIENSPLWDKQKCIEKLKI